MKITHTSNKSVITYWRDVLDSGGSKDNSCENSQCDIINTLVFVASLTVSYNS